MIRRMNLDDIPAAMRLKQAAGWNQTELDWSNVLGLEPEGCWVYETEGQVAGSTSAICYGEDLAWIGMVLVAPGFRGRGFARALMERALEFLETRRVRLIKLDATDMGKPLYGKLGFEEECAIERWTAPAARTTPAQPLIPVKPLGNLNTIATLDRRAFGVDRTAVLQRLRDCFPDQCLETAGGYAMARPGSEAHFVGPCVAESPAAARGLIEALLRGLEGRTVFWDLLPQNREALRLAQELGFEQRRRLVRMSRRAGSAAAAVEGDSLLQFATAGFEYG